MPERGVDGDAGDILDFATTQIAAFLGSVVENGINYDRFRIGNTSFGVQQGIIFHQGLAPNFVSAGTLALAEGQTFVTDLAAVDDTDTEGAGLTYSIVGGADAGSFTIDAVNGALNFSVTPDFETPADADGNGQYEVVVRVTDSRGLATDTGLTVDVERALSTEEATNFYDYTPQTDPQVQRAVSAAQQLSGTTTLAGASSAAAADSAAASAAAEDTAPAETAEGETAASEPETAASAAE